MANDNCLAGMQCPQCGSEGPFVMEVTTLVLMSDEGNDPWWNDGGGVETQWNNASYCQCRACAYQGTVADFTITKEG